MHDPTLVNDHLTELIAQRGRIEQAMAHYLAASRLGEATAVEQTAAHRLLDVLLAGPEGKRSSAPLDDPAIRQFADRFGDGLSPILRDIFGSELQDAVVAHCVDRYWAGLRRV